EEGAAARAPIGAGTKDPRQKNSDVERVAIFDYGKRGASELFFPQRLRGLAQAAVKFARRAALRRLFVVQPRGQRAVGLAQGPERRGHVGIGEPGRLVGEREDGGGHRGQERAIHVQHARGKLDLGKRHFRGRRRLAVLFLLQAASSRGNAVSRGRGGGLRCSSSCWRARIR